MKLLILRSVPWCLLLPLCLVSCKDKEREVADALAKQVAIEAAKREAAALRDQLHSVEAQKKQMEHTHLLEKQELDDAKKALEKEKAKLTGERNAAKDTPQPMPTGVAATTEQVPLSQPVASVEPVLSSVGQDIFYDKLLPYGKWFTTEDYGYIWQPTIAVQDTQWQPYTYGRWLDSDLGWTWYSDEPFGWATYHYGRWARCRNVGWVWVPGNTWAPAWVSFRRSSACIGWAPLPPETLYLQNVGPQVDADYQIQPEQYCFVPLKSLDQPVRKHLHPPQHCKANFAATRCVASMTVLPDKVHCNGPSMEWIMAKGCKPIEKCKIQPMNDLKQVQPKLTQGSYQVARVHIADQSLNLGTYAKPQVPSVQVASLPAQQKTTAAFDGFRRERQRHIERANPPAPAQAVAATNTTTQPRNTTLAPSLPPRGLGGQMNPNPRPNYTPAANNTPEHPKAPAITHQQGANGQWTPAQPTTAPQVTVAQVQQQPQVQAATPPVANHVLTPLQLLEQRNQYDRDVAAQKAEAKAMAQQVQMVQQQQQEQAAAKQAEIEERHAAKQAEIAKIEAATRAEADARMQEQLRALQKQQEEERKQMEAAQKAAEEAARRAEEERQRREEEQRRAREQADQMAKKAAEEAAKEAEERAKANQQPSQPQLAPQPGFPGLR